MSEFDINKNESNPSPEEQSDRSPALRESRRAEKAVGQETIFTESKVTVSTKKKRSVLKLQKKLIALFLVIVMLLGVAYAVVYKIVTRNVFIDERGDGAKYYVMEKGGSFVITDKDEYTLKRTDDGKYYVTEFGNIVDVDEETGEVSYYAYVDTEGSEQVGVNDKLLVFPHTEKSQIQEIEVHNEYGSYTFLREKKDGVEDFVLKGNEDIPYDQEKFSQLVVATGYSLTIQKIPNDLSSKYGMGEYGFLEEERVDEDGNKYTYKPAWYKITDLKGNVYKMVIGNRIPSNAGYYVKLDTRDSVYIISDANVEDSVLAPVEDLCEPIISVPGTTGDYFDVKGFLFWNDPTDFEDPFKTRPMITFDYLDLEDRNKTEFQTTPYFAFDEITSTDKDGNQIKYEVNPKIGGYAPNEYAIDLILQTLYLLPSRKDGVRVEKIGITDADLDTYGLDKPAFRMFFTFKDIVHDIIFSEKSKDGTYYVLSPIADMIVEIDKKYLDFFEWNDEKWMSKDVIQFNIAFVKEVELTAQGLHYTFLCDNSKSDMTDKVMSDKMVITVKELGKTVDLEQFRDFFLTLVFTEFEGESGLSKEEADSLVKDPSKLMLTLRYETEGRKRELKFYRYSERRAYVTINGIGGLYLLVPQVEKIIADTDKVINGGTISGTDKYN